MTLKECKDKIAQQEGYTSWDWIIAEYPSNTKSDKSTEQMLEEAAELYARSKWDDACEAQKINCEKRAGIDNDGETIVGIMSAPKPEFKP